MTQRIHLKLRYTDACDHDRETRRAVHKTVRALKPRLAAQNVNLVLQEYEASHTRLYLGNTTPFRVSRQPCFESDDGWCDGFLYQGEFFEALSEAAVTQAVLEATQLAKTNNIQAPACCGSGCLDCPY